jgi:hypothetical protein
VQGGLDPHYDPICALAEVGLLFGFKPPDPQWVEMCLAMHDKQRAAVQDLSVRKAILGGRRAGKTEAAVYWLIQGWRDHPKQWSIYIATTIGSARDIMWDKLKDICERWELGCVFNESRLEVVFPNGYKISVTGCENRKQANRVGRGKKFRRVVIDELEIFEDELIKYFIRSSLKPTLMDYGGQLMLLGTPGFALHGFWFDITEEEDEDDEPREKGRAKRWPTHRMNATDNPFIGYEGGAQKFFEDELEENGWEWDNPEFVRELLGKWVKDATAYIYPFNPGKNLWDGDTGEDFELDPPGWGNDDTVRTVIGVDIGGNDGCGFSVVRKRWDGEELRVMTAYCRPNLDDDEIATEIKRLMRRYKTHHVFMDSKGHGATTICRSMLKYGIPAKPAENNHRKLPLIRATRAVIRNGRLKLHPVSCAELVAQLRAMTWNADRDSHQDGIPDEAIDATLWAVFEVGKLAAAVKAKKVKPVIGSEEFEQLQEKLENMASMRRAERLQRQANPTHRAKPRSRGRATRIKA